MKLEKALGRSVEDSEVEVQEEEVICHELHARSRLQSEIHDYL